MPVFVQQKGTGGWNTLLTGRTLEVHCVLKRSGADTLCIIHSKSTRTGPFDSYSITGSFPRTIIAETAKVKEEYFHANSESNSRRGPQLVNIAVSGLCWTLDATWIRCVPNFHLGSGRSGAGPGDLSRSNRAGQ